jgi:hypothetical protein
MRRALSAMLLISPLMLATACRDRAPGENLAARGGSDERITVTGCLAGVPDRQAFVVTTSNPDPLVASTLRATSGEIPTYSYELVGDTDLSAHVGRMVEVTGRLVNQTKRDVDVDSKDKTQMPQSQVRRDATPAVETDAEVELRVRHLQVSSVVPTGTSCE